MGRPGAATDGPPPGDARYSRGADGQSAKGLPVEAGQQSKRWLSILLVVLLGLLTEAWFPFRPALPWSTRVAPHRDRGGLVSFGRRSVLTSGGPQAWVADAAATDTFRVDLEVRTDRADQTGPARLLSVSRDVYAADLMIGQDHADLVVRIRRPGSDLSGEPPYRLVGVFASPGWQAVTVRLTAGVLDLTVNGEPAGAAGGVVGDAIGPPGLAGWDSAYSVTLGDERRGNRAWSGQIRTATVATPRYTVDLLDPQVLAAGRGTVFGDRWPKFTALATRDPLLVSLLRAAAFVPIGVGLRCVRRLRRSLPLNAAQLVLLAIALTAGKLFMAGRHAAVSDVLLTSAGGLLGIGLADRARRRRLTPGRGVLGERSKSVR